MIKGGFQEDLTMICDELGIANFSNTDHEWVATKIVESAVAWESKKISTTLVPDVTGYTLRDAIYILENMGFKVETTGIGRVSTQSLVPGRKFSKGDKIKLELG